VIHSRAGDAGGASAAAASNRRDVGLSAAAAAAAGEARAIAADACRAIEEAEAAAAAAAGLERARLEAEQSAKVGEYGPAMYETRTKCGKVCCLVVGPSKASSRLLCWEYGPRAR
jgi:hypothetical protein